MSFRDRMARAATLEQDLLDEVNAVDGWLAEPFGQGQLSESVRSTLVRCDTLLRWLPDVIAVHEYHPSFVLLDAKACRDDTPNWDVETKSIDAAQALHGGLGADTWYVFPDWSVASWVDFSEHGRLGPPSAKGSGTPYTLLDKSYASWSLRRLLSMYELLGLAAA